MFFFLYTPSFQNCFKQVDYVYIGLTDDQESYGVIKHS